MSRAVGLAAHRTHGRGARTDEYETRGRARLGEICVLCQESIAGMHPVGARRPTHVHQLVDPKVALRRLVRADRMRFVGQPHMKRIPIALRIHRNRGEPHFAARPDNPHGDLAAIGDQYLVQVGRTSGSASVIVAFPRTYRADPESRIPNPGSVREVYCRVFLEGSYRAWSTAWPTRGSTYSALPEAE